jgi:FSR family fosmidomycin resistance protein-like MFS transporter
MQATLLGREHFSGRANTAAAMFFLFGQVGLSLGPAIGGLLIDRMELSGLTLLLLFVVPVGLFAGRNWSQSTTPEKQPEVQDDNPRFVFRSAIPFILLVAFRSWSQANMTAFLPKYYSDLGFRPAVYGSITALFMAGSALGNLTGGYLGDRITGRSVVVGTLLLATVPMALFPVLGPTGWAYLLVLVIGFLTGAPHSILVVIAQRFFPGRMGMASGVILGFMFASGSFGTMLSGIQADWLGFNAVFLTTAGVVLLGAFLGNKLPRFSQDTTFSSQT